jgi:hypothetical protein
MTRLVISFTALLLGVTSLGAADQARIADGPEFTPKGEMRSPRDYREWVFLSSGLGMTYGPLGAAGDNDNPTFDNVYVNRTAYRYFLSSGRWPDKTVLVLEVRSSQSKGSINHGGHFQTGRVGIEVHVKDAARFQGGWAFFSFDGGTESAKAIPASANCYSCHSASGAVDTTFVQFYPTLLDIAHAKNTFNATHALRNIE